MKLARGEGIGKESGRRRNLIIVETVRGMWRGGYEFVHLSMPPSSSNQLSSLKTGLFHLLVAVKGDTDV